MNQSIDKYVIDYTALDIQGSVSDSVDVFVKDLPHRMQGRYEEHDGVRREKFIETEIKFIGKVLNATMELIKSRSGPITILFDIDETIARNVYGENEEVTTYVRPGLAILIEQLQKLAGNRVDVGLLTSRAENHLAEELGMPTYLGAIKDKVNPDFVFSSRAGSSVYNHEALMDVPRWLESGDESDALRAIEKIIRPDLKEYGEANDFESVESAVDRGHWYDSKLAILQHVASEYPDRGFVFVDDLPFPDSVDPSHKQVRGVSLQDARFSL